jgi:hypothetical protein
MRTGMSAFVMRSPWPQVDQVEGPECKVGRVDRGVEKLVQLVAAKVKHCDLIRISLHGA